MLDDPPTFAAARDAHRASARRFPHWLVAVIVVASVAGGAMAVWKGGLEDRFVAKRFGVVDDGLIYRSGQLSQYVVRDTLAKHDIKVIVDLTADVPSDPDQAAEAAAAQELGIERCKFPLGGSGTGKIENYADAVALMCTASRDNKAVLVHCSAGTQRTGGATAFYRLLVQRREPDEVLADMRRHGWHGDADSPLIVYLNEHMEEMGQLLIARGVIDAAPDPVPQLSP